MLAVQDSDIRVAVSLAMIEFAKRGKVSLFILVPVLISTLQLSLSPPLKVPFHMFSVYGSVRMHVFVRLLF